MAEKLRWGIIGAGGIAGAFVQGVKSSKRGEMLAIASRSQAKADAFGEENDVPRRYGSYEAMLEDGDVDAVYVATPHPMHAVWAIRCAEAGKHILCEKPVTLNAAEAMTVIDAANRHDVFFMEAFMYRCTAQTRRIVGLIRDRAIGDVRAIEARFSFDVGDNVEGRHLKHDLAGGGIMDIGCYCASMARLIAGVANGGEVAEPLEVHAVGSLHEKTGTDVYTTALLKFPGDIIASLTCAVQLGQPSTVTVYGTEGQFEVLSPWFCQGHTGGSSKIIVHPKGQKSRTITVRSSAGLYSGEVDHVAKNLRKREGQFPAMSKADTLGNIQVLDQWRAAVGLEYEMEKPENMTTPISGRPLRRDADVKMRYGKIPGLEGDVSILAMGSTLPNFHQSSAVFDRYVESGGNVFDSAWVYGRTDGTIGQWIRNRNIRSDVYVLAKGAHPPHCTPEGMRRECQETLDRMQADYIDIYMLHRDNLEVPVGEWIDVLNEHCDAGTIRVFGGSNWTIARIEEANAYAAANGKRGFSALSNNFSLARMVEPPWPDCRAASDDASRGWHEDNQFPLFPWSSQAQGFFVPSLAGPDRPDFAFGFCWYSEENFERARRATQIAEKRRVDPTAVALAYVLHQKFPVFPLFCPHDPGQLTSSLKALSIRLSAKEVEWLDLRADSPS